MHSLTSLPSVISLFTNQPSRLNTILRLVPALLLGTLFLSMVYFSDTGSRTVVMRYFLFGYTGLVAFILPYISFPEQQHTLVRILNLSSRKIFRLYIIRHRMIWGVPAFLILVIAFGGHTVELFNEFADRFLLFLYGLLFLSGIYTYAASIYLKVGPDSQKWNEGNKGMKTRQRFAEYGKYPLDPGSVPSMIASVKITVIGMMAVVLGATMYGWAGFAGELSVAFFIFLFGGYSILKPAEQTDRYFYHTHSFFSEFFGTGPGHSSEREPLQVRQLWWVPLRWKTHSWALMLELDRRIPAGRILALGHLFVWVLAYQRPDERVLLMIWALFAVFHHSLLIFTSDESLAPRWWLRYLDRSIHWSLSRFWVQVRWILPLALSMAVMKGVFGVFAWMHVGWVLILYLTAGILAAMLTTFNQERRWNA
ncbi:MAG: hypothetical protein WD035_00805 [Balneolaceae bacterium]